MKQYRTLAIFILLSASFIVSLILLSRSSDSMGSMNNLQQTVQNPQDIITTPVSVPAGLEVATFAGGCFWCVEAVFQETNGISDVISGYAGGQEVNPTYRQVYTGSTGHREAIQFYYDPEIISYTQILDILWTAIDPTDDGGQFVDRGFAYTTAIFYHDVFQQENAEASLDLLSQSGRFDQPIVTPILPFTTFYPAEEYHQDYYLKAPTQYERYESNSGRDEYKEQIWEIIESAQ